MAIGSLRGFQEALSSCDLETIKEAGEYLRRLENLCANRNDEVALAGLARRRTELRDSYLSMRNYLNSGVNNQEAKSFVDREINRLNSLLREV